MEPFHGDRRTAKWPGNAARTMWDKVHTWASHRLPQEGKLAEVNLDQART